MTDFSQLTNDKLEQKYQMAREIQANLLKIGVHHICDADERAQYKKNMGRIECTIKELDRERFRRAIKDAEDFLRSIEKL